MVLNFCPEWIFDVTASAAAREFLQSPLGLDTTVKKFQQGLTSLYNPIDVAQLAEACEQLLLVLNDADAGEEAVIFIENFCYFRLNFEMNKAPRKLSGLFGNELKGTKTIQYNSDNTRKRFKAYLFAMRNGGMPKAPAGWNLENDTTVPALTELIAKKVNILDSL